MATDPDTDVEIEVPKGITPDLDANPAYEANGRWQMFAHGVGEFQKQGKVAPTQRGILTMVSPEGEIHTFDFESGGIPMDGGNGRVAPGGELFDHVESIDGVQGIYGLQFDIGSGNYMVDSTASGFTDEDGRGSQLFMHPVPGVMDMEGRSAFLIHTLRGTTAGCIGLNDEEEKRFFGLLEEIRQTAPETLPTHLTMLGGEGSEDPNKELTEAFEAAHNAGDKDGERTADEEVTAEMLALNESVREAGVTASTPGGMTAAEMLMMMGTSTQAELQARGVWTGHSAAYGHSPVIRQLQTNELKNYYPQSETEGLSARAAEIAGDGMLGEITHHGSQLALDETGEFANSHIAETLKADYWGDPELLKLDASLNRYSELTDGVEVVAVDGVIREADVTRLAKFVEDWRANNEDQTYKLGGAAINAFTDNGYDVESLSDLTGMDAAAIEEAKALYEELEHAGNRPINETQQRIAEAIPEAAEAAGIHPDLLRGVWGIETNYSQADLYGGDAQGHFQFIAGTWDDTFNKHIASLPPELRSIAETAQSQGHGAVQNLKFHPEISAHMSAHYLSDVASDLGVDPMNLDNAGDIFMGYNLGPGNASRVLNGEFLHPGNSKAAAANPLFFNNVGSAADVRRNYQSIVLDRATNAPVLQDDTLVAGVDPSKVSRVVTWGDSIADGMGMHADLNLGVTSAGYLNDANRTGLQSELDTSISQIRDGDLVVVNVGTNDDGFMTSQAQIDEFVSDMDTRLDAIIRKGGQPVIVGTDAAKFPTANSVLRSIAENKGLPFVERQGEATGADGVHLRDYGALLDRVVDTVMKAPPPADPDLVADAGPIKPNPVSAPVDAETDGTIGMIHTAGLIEPTTAEFNTATGLRKVGSTPVTLAAAESEIIIDPSQAKFSALAYGASAKAATPSFDTARADDPAPDASTSADADADADVAADSENDTKITTPEIKPDNNAPVMA